MKIILDAKKHRDNLDFHYFEIFGAGKWIGYSVDDYFYTLHSDLKDSDIEVKAHFLNDVPPPVSVHFTIEHEPTWQDQPTGNGYYWFKAIGCQPLIRIVDSDCNWLTTPGKWYGPIKPPEGE